MKKMFTYEKASIALTYRAARRFNRINLRLWTFRHSGMQTSVIKCASISAPGACIFRFTSYAQTAVRMVSMRTEHIALVQNDVDGVNIVIAIPCDINFRFIFDYVLLV